MKKSFKNDFKRFKKMIYTPPKNFLLTQAKKSFLYWKKRFYIYILRHSMVSTRQKKFTPKKPFGVFFSCPILYNNC